MEVLASGTGWSRRGILLALTAAAAGAHRLFAQAGQTPAPESAFSIPEDARLLPADLSKQLNAAGSPKAALFQVGSRVFFAQAHIPGSVYAGPGSREEGLKLLGEKTAGLAKDQAIVLYCGCCPWERCPNIAPAWRQLKQQGFSNLRALMMEHNFGDDWVAKGYAGERGQ